MLTAASFETVSASRGRPGVLPVPNVPEHVTEIAVDPGGFVAATHGGYKFSWDTYVDWLHQLGPRLTWAAFPDLCVEPELASDARAVRQRQEQTLEWAWEFWGGKDDTESFWMHPDHPWAWVPTIQGRNLDEYVWMAKELAPLFCQQDFDYGYLGSGNYDIADSNMEDDSEILLEKIATWSMHCATHRRIGIGSLCQRRDTKEIVRIVQAVHEILPGMTFHLWGVKVSSLRELMRAGLIDCIASFDTAAFNGAFGRDLEKRRYEMRTMHVSQRAHGLTVALPRYQRKVAGALAQRNLL
jgi:hypothetical protein